MRMDLHVDLEVTDYVDDLVRYSLGGMRREATFVVLVLDVE